MILRSAARINCFLSTFLGTGSLYLKFTNIQPIQFFNDNYRYCTPCPDLSHNYTGELITELDRLCKKFAEDNVSPKGINVAKFLSKVKQLAPPLFKIFFAACKAKSVFEEEMNRPYNSFFYTHLFTHQQPIHNIFFYFNEMDKIPFNKSKKLEMVRVLENQWISDIKVVWQSTCYGNIMMMGDSSSSSTINDIGSYETKNCKFVKYDKKRVIRGTVPEFIDHSKKGLRFTLPGYR